MKMGWVHITTYDARCCGAMIKQKVALGVVIIFYLQEGLAGRHGRKARQDSAAWDCGPGCGPGGAVRAEWGRTMHSDLGAAVGEL